MEKVRLLLELVRKREKLKREQVGAHEVLAAMPMTRWLFNIVPCLARGNASAACLKMLVMRFADVQ